MQESSWPPPNKLISLAEAARIAGMDPSRLSRRTNLGLIDADRVGRTFATTLRRLVDSWDRRGARGPQPALLPPELVAYARRQEAPSEDGEPGVERAVS